MTSALRVFSYGHGGLGVALLCLAAWLLCRSRAAPGSRMRSIFPWLVAITGIGVLVDLSLTSWYLFSPAYMDHVEASVASNVHYFMSGAPLYPPATSYRLGGLVYGPLLSELNSLGYIVPLDAFSAKIVGWLAGWGSVAILAMLFPFHERNRGNGLAWIYLLGFLVPFGADLVVARAEPPLLLASAGALVIAMNVPTLSAAVLLGLLCGAVAALKIHAPLYLVPALSLWLARYVQQERASRNRDWVLAAAFLLAGCVGLILPFAPANVSVAAFARYLDLVSHHGLSGEEFRRNAAFMLGLWAPLLLVGTKSESGQPTRSWRGPVLALLIPESLVLVIASKPGAGLHHFLPFIAPHALLFRELCAAAAASMQPRAFLAAAAVLAGAIVPTSQTLPPLLQFDLLRAWQMDLKDELLALTVRFPGGMLGATDNESYSLLNYRPWLTALGTNQTDYGAYMDLNLSGVSDEALREAFSKCSIPFVYTPASGQPFSLESVYERELFTDELRRVFAERYSRVYSGIHFDVFACKP